jgi:N-methylhydantoinase A
VSTARAWFAGIDVGGTFTDVVLASTGGDVFVGKVLTTPDDPRDGVVEGITSLVEESGIDPGCVRRVVHGTTLATNIVLQGAGDPVALVATAGFGDVLRLGREARVEEDRFDLRFTPLRPPVDPQLTFEVCERVNARGEVLEPLTDAGVADVTAALRAARPVSVAICPLHAYANPDHERRVLATCREAMPDAYVVASSDVCPEIREYERAMTTVVCAIVGPQMGRYLAGLEERLRAAGFDGALQIMESSGGVMSATAAARRPVATVESGGAAGVIAAGIVGRAVGAVDVISFDMGGTTAKAGIVRDGRAAVTHDFQIGGKGSFGGTRQGTGVPLKIPVVDLAEVGAGGGSIAWVDPGGALRVGPRSAGAAPGPAAYGRGGDDATVTDANLLLGYLGTAGLAGGVTLRRDLAAVAVEHAVARPLGIDTIDAARAVHEVINATMAAAIRVVTVQRGIDPREFTLVAFGGAGPMHAARLAATFGVGSVVVPWAAGVASAVGLVSSDLTVDVAQTRLLDLAGTEPSVLDDLFTELETRGRVELARCDDGAYVVTRSADLRFRGQAHQLTVPVLDGPFGDEEASALAKRFHEHYQRTYGIAADAPIELVCARVRVVRIVDKFGRTTSPMAERAATPAMRTERAAYFSETAGFVPTPVYEWDGLARGHQIEGPAIVEGRDATIVVPPGHRASVDGWQNVVLTAVPA